MTPSNVTPSGMTDHAAAVADLARDLVRIDSRSPLSNRPLAERIEAELAGFEVDQKSPAHPGCQGQLILAHRQGSAAAADQAPQGNSRVGGPAHRV